ncbi:hypothetical protein [Candidatus Pantoea multigeneris]|uniref:Uncharacterized protein n=1 Tax=Candidatus Pantoea multigeneris TaxID=2608357 RepID=A0ABX0RGX3_9GAMM|nr:hypothetical protein [Pantoea multigeneris]NIF24049.1 hypothetical protein [Pantoea multigeneris]
MNTHNVNTAASESTKTWVNGQEKQPVASGFAEMKAAASGLLTKFQTGKLSRDELYAQGSELTHRYNALVQAAGPDCNSQDADDTADLLFALRHFATC